MPPVGFEPTTAVLERAKAVRALDRASTAIGSLVVTQQMIEAAFVHVWVHDTLSNKP
jgi:hypothetical protein